METLYARHLQLRNHSLALTSTLTAEDQCVHARLPYLFNSYYEALGPCHLRQVAPFQIAHRLVNCGEYLAFVQDGGYAKPLLWLSDGWAQVQSQAWAAPLYWIAPGDPRCPSADWQSVWLAGRADARRCGACHAFEFL